VATNLLCPVILSLESSEGQEGAGLKTRGYEIRIESHLSDTWSSCFEGLTIRHAPDGETILTGQVDQAALHGALAKIRDLGLTLVSVHQITDGEER
jgi:hypothetical protein